MFGCLVFEPRFKSTICLMWRGNTSSRPQCSVVRTVVRLWETNFLTTEEVQVLFCMLFPVFRQILEFLKVTKVLPLLLFVTIILSLKWTWVINKMELTAKSCNSRREIVAMPLCLQQIQHRLAQDRTRVFAVRGRRPIVWAMAQPWRIKCI